MDIIFNFSLSHGSSVTAIKLSSIGEGKEVTHERCPRSRLQQRCIKYLGPASFLWKFAFLSKVVQNIFRTDILSSQLQKWPFHVGEGQERGLPRWQRFYLSIRRLIDPCHRYGHNLQFYNVTWLHCDSNQPFFYWLDIGEGKKVTHK